MVHKEKVGRVVMLQSHTALASKVLAVYSVWAPLEDQDDPLVRQHLENGYHRELWVCVDAVPGINHDDEWREVLRVGDKVPERIGRAIFPHLSDCEYRR